MILETILQSKNLIAHSEEDCFQFKKQHDPFSIVLRYKDTKETYVSERILSKNRKQGLTLKYYL
jgi:hypothetical protein